MDKPDEQPEESNRSLADEAGEVEIGERVARELSGDLRCVQCGYNLRGLSVRAMCSECGTPVLATVLGVVDPRAEQLRPIPRPRLVAGGMIVWSGAALLAVLLSWGVHLTLAGGAEVGSWVVPASAGALAVSGVGALVLVRPHAGIEARRIRYALVAIGLYIPLVLVHYRLLVPLSVLDRSPFLTTDGLSRETHLLRLALGGVAVAIIVLLRPMARVLAARSLIVRTGRVDRQSMLSLAAALGVAAAGDLVGLGASFATDIVAGLLSPIALILIGVGSLLFTIGLGGVLLDCVRIAPVILHSPVGVEQAFGERAFGEGGMFEE